MPITDAGVIDRTLVALLEEALGAVESDDYGRRAMLMSRLAHELYWSDESQRVTSLAREAIDIARRLGDIPTLIYVLHYGYLSLWVPENLQERFAAFEELISLARKNRSNHWMLRGRQLRFVSLLEMGEIEGAREELAAFGDLAAQLQQPHGILELCEASIALLEGKLDKTRQIAESALAIGESLEGRIGQFRQTASVIEFTLRWQEGRLGELHQVFKDIADRSSILRFALRMCSQHAAPWRFVIAKAETERTRRFSSIGWWLITLARYPARWLVSAASFFSPKFALNWRCQPVEYRTSCSLHTLRKIRRSHGT